MNIITGVGAVFFRDLFRLVPVDKVAQLGDALLRNQILTSNEMRGILGFKPSEQEGADMLQNPNMPFGMTFNGEVANGQLPPEEIEDEYTDIAETPEVEEYPAQETLPDDGAGRSSA
jgi:hypothetical protein